MGKLFRPDSPLMRFMMLITNLICLNVLWLLCCLPVVTAGAATAAMYSVLFLYITKQDDGVLKPYFKAFKENFKSVTPAWILHLLIGAALGAEAFYLSQGSELWLKAIFGILLFLYMGVGAYLYPILARYETTRKQALMNSILLSARHFFTTVCMVVLQAVPMTLILLRPDYFWKSILLWTVGGFSLIAYLCAKMILPVLKKYDPQPAEETEEGSEA
jgi:uncharacterized membrane protein YesL